MSAPSNGQACLNHPGKYRQGRSGLCRECERAAEGDRRRIAGELEAINRRRRQKRAEPPPAPPQRELVYRGVVYVVTWDGSMAGAAALGLPLAADRGDPRWAPGSGRRA